MLQIKADTDLFPFLEAAKAGSRDDEVAFLGGEGGIKKGLFPQLFEEVDFGLKALFVIRKVSFDGNCTRANACDKRLFEPTFVEILHSAFRNWQGDVISLELQFILAVLFGDGGGKEIHLRCSDEPCDELVDGVKENIFRRANLLDDSIFQYDDFAAHRHCLNLVVGDVDEDGLQLVVETGDFRAHLHAHLRVEVGKWLIEQEDLGVADDGSS